MSSMFDGLYIARSGVHASKTGLNITGQNITNASTDGYTRQRVDQYSIPPSDGSGLWAALGNATGCGTTIDSVEQLRDAFLDYEYRTLNAKSGGSSKEIDTLNDLQDIFTSTTTASSSSKSSVVDILSDEFKNFTSQLQSLTSIGSNVSESNVRDEAKILTQKLNTAAQALETARVQQYTNLRDQGVNTVNGLLADIVSYNKQIKDAEISGSPALELQDQRNLLLDKLSKYASIKVVQTPTTIAPGRTVDTMSVYLADPDGSPLTYTDGAGHTQTYSLIDDDKYAQFKITPSTSITSSDTVKLSLSTLSTNGSLSSFQYDAANLDSDHAINSEFQSGSFSGYLHLLNDQGEYDGSSFRGIRFYSDYLDTLAQTLSSTLNKLNSMAGTNIDADALLTGTNAAGADDVTKVTAKNIHVANVWNDGHLLMTKDPSPSGSSNKASYSNITTMIAELENDQITLSTPSGKTLFTGTLGTACSNAGGMLAQSANGVQATDNTNSSQLNSINGKRQQISSISIDDEAVNIVQYSQSLNASSRFMTAVDECIQTIINNMGLAGR